MPAPKPEKPEKPEQPEIVTPVEARQGRLGRDVLYVLLISLSLAIVAAVVLLTWASPKSPGDDKVGLSRVPVTDPTFAGQDTEERVISLVVSSSIDNFVTSCKRFYC